MKIQNALVSNMLDRSQRYFAHVTTVTLSWRVQNIVVIGRAYFTLDCFEFSSNFEFDRNMLSGTGARCPFYWRGWTLIPAWIRNHMSSKVCDEIVYPFPNFKVEVWEWINDSIIHFIMGVQCNHLSMVGLKLNHVNKRGPGVHGYEGVVSFMVIKSFQVIKRYPEEVTVWAWFHHSDW